MKINVTGANSSEGTEAIAPPPGKNIVHSLATGDPLPIEDVAADHNPTIPWPAAVAVEHKPFKFTK